MCNYYIETMLIICWISYKLFRFFMFNLLVHSQLYWWQVFYQYGRQSSVFWGAITLFYWWCHQMGFLLFVIRLPISKNVWFNHLMIKRVPGWIGTEKIGMTFTQNEKKNNTDYNETHILFIYRPLIEVLFLTFSNLFQLSTF